MDPDLLRNAWNFVIVLALTMLVALGASAQGMEYDTDRLGGDFDRVTLQISDPKACLAICQSTDVCVAWTYTPVGFDDYETPQCWLKDKQSRPFERLGVTSGTLPSRFSAAELSTDLPERSEMAAAALAECNNPDNWFQPGLDLSELCMQQKAKENMDSTICAALADEPRRQACYASAGIQTMLACDEILDGGKKELCQMAVAVEFPHPKSCMAAPEHMKLQCHVTVASETGDFSAFLQELNYVSDEDRDVWIGSLAVTAQTYDLLELIEDNATYDKILIAVAQARIASGKYVETGTCSMLVGGYDDPYGDDLSAAEYRSLCIEGVALARVLNDWAEDKSPEEILEMQNQMETYAEQRAEMDSEPEFPMGLGPAIRREMEKEQNRMRSATATQSGQIADDSQSGSTATNSGSEIEYETPYTDNCIFGVCPE